MAKTKKSKDKSANKPTIEGQKPLNLQIISQEGEVYININRPTTQIHFNAAQAAQFGRAMETAAARANDHLVTKLQELAKAVGGADNLREIAKRAKNNGGPIEAKCEN